MSSIRIYSSPKIKNKTYMYMQLQWTYRLDLFVFPVDGKWGGWSSWSRYSSCSVTCGAGLERYKRWRYCNKPTRKNGGRDCSGQRYSYEYRNCYRSKCPSKSYHTVHSKVVLVLYWVTSYSTYYMYIDLWYFCVWYWLLCVIKYYVHCTCRESQCLGF